MVGGLVGLIFVWYGLNWRRRIHPDPPTYELTNLPVHTNHHTTQDDTLLSSLTPRETLTFAARLRLPMALTGAEKRQRVAMYVFFLLLYLFEKVCVFVYVCMCD